ncbi:MAG: Asp23/Gls24 family envelope stress response protein [Jatrophihabitans sp.]
MTSAIDQTAQPGTGAGQPGDDRPSPPVGRTEWGLISIQDRVVATLAARAAVEIPDAGGAAPRILGRSLDGVLGTRDTSLDSLPKTSADVDGSQVVLELQISVRWPASVPDTAAQVRRHVAARVTELTGLQVTEVQIQVTDLVTHLAPPPRVS